MIRLSKIRYTNCMFCLTFYEHFAKQLGANTAISLPNFTGNYKGQTNRTESLQRFGVESEKSAIRLKCILEAMWTCGLIFRMSRNIIAKKLGERCSNIEF